MATSRDIGVFLVLFLIHTVQCIEDMEAERKAVCPKIEKCKCLPFKKHEYLLVFKCKGTSLPNVIAKLPNNTGSFMYSAQEMLVDLGSTDFSHLSKLRELFIKGIDINIKRRLKKLTINDTNVFKPLTNLKSLNLNLAWEQGSPISKLFVPLQNLHTLDLSNTKKLNFDVVADMLRGFESSRNLKYLNFWNIQNMDAAKPHLNFTELIYPVSNCPIYNLNVGYNAIQILYPGLTRYARNLKDLLLSYNFINNLFQTSGVIDLLVHPTLQFVNLEYQGYGFLRHQRQKTFAIMDRQTSANQTRDFRSGFRMLGSHFVNEDDLEECLKSLGNRLCDIFEAKCDAVRQFLQQSHNNTCAILHRYVGEYFEGIPCENIPRFQDLFKESCAGCIVIPFTGSMTKVRFTHLNIYDEMYFDPLMLNKTICFNSHNNVKMIDISYNRDRGYPQTAISLDTRFVGLETLEELNTAQIGLTKLSPITGRNFPNLKRFDLSDNAIRFDNATHLFEGLESLEIIKLSENDIKIIPKKIFANLRNITEIFLRHNLIEHFDVDLTSLSKLEILELGDNEITRLSESVMRDLDRIASQTNRSKIKLNLSKNDLICSCYNIDFIDWAVRSKHPKLKLMKENETMCINRNSHRVLLSMEALNELNRECRGFWVSIVITVGITAPVTLLLFTLAIFTYRKRWWFRYQYFLAKQLWRSYKRCEEVANNYQYDVFVSYNQRDSEWVDDLLQPMLEDEHGLKLCLHHRDFMFGEYIEEQIIRSIENSRKTLLVMTPNFLASTWCQFEMQMARNKLFSCGKDVLLLALLKPLPRVGISKILKGLLEQKTYIEWSDDEYGQKLFWAKLVQAIEAPRNEPFDLDYPEVQSINYGNADENTGLLA